MPFMNLKSFQKQPLGVSSAEVLSINKHVC